nr:MAG TPA: hypothetical protein [Caudoviricetes sp.]
MFNSSVKLIDLVISLINFLTEFIELINTLFV